MFLVLRVFLLQYFPAVLYHVVVPVLGLQHEQDLLQVLEVDLLRTLSGTQHGDDAFSDVGQICLLTFLHGRRAARVSGCRKRRGRA